MKKRAISLALTLVMVCGLLPVTARAAELDNGLTYKVYGDHVEITGCPSDTVMLVIPAEIEGLPVTAISDYAFDWCKKLISITIPDSVSSIGSFAFQNCESLLSIDIPEGVTAIGEYTFYQCSRLSEIDLPDSLTAIGKYAFYDCNSLVSIDIPDGVTAIADTTFYLCDSLTSVDLPDNLISIGNSAFRNCKSLTSIDIPDSVAAIGDMAFSQCWALSSVHLPDSLISINKNLFLQCTSLTSITVPGNIVMIYTQAFSQCDNLTSIYFTGDAPWIEDDVFTSMLSKITATAYYPAGNTTWTEDVMQDYGGDITWVPYNPSNPFTDVPVDAFYETPVLWALENGITTGATETTFNPNGSCLRAHVVTFLHRAAGNPVPNSASNPFSDVKSGDFFYNPVLWAVEKGITNGVSATKFGSYDVCNRAAVVTFLWRAAGCPEPESAANPFVDVKATDFYYKAVLWAVEKGITNGIDAAHFGPTADCNRAQVVTFLYRAFGE